MSGTITTANIVWMILNALCSLFLIIFNNRHQQAIRKEENQESEKQEREKFKKTIESIPKEVIQVIKKGLDKNSLATKMHFGSKATKHDDVTGEPEEYEHYLEFGEYSEPISKELHDKEGNIEDFLVNNDFSKPTTCGTFGRTPMILNPKFLEKVEKWG